VTARLFRTAAVAIGGLLMLGVSFGAVAPTATAGPGDPTAEECRVIAEQAIAKGITPEEQLALSGGGICDFATILGVTVAPGTGAPATGAPATAAPATVKGSSLPKTGSSIGPIIALGSAALVFGVSILLLVRRRKTLV
jgi:LPXTG-motif cell wall-anchored protein